MYFLKCFSFSVMVCF